MTWYLEPQEVEDFLDFAQIYADGVMIDGQYYEFGDERILKLWSARQRQQQAALEQRFNEIKARAEEKLNGQQG